MTTPGSPELSDEQLKIVERVQKILALADRNPNQAEAAVAAGKAQDQRGGTSSCGDSGQSSRDRAGIPIQESETKS